MTTFLRQTQQGVSSNSLDFALDFSQSTSSWCVIIHPVCSSQGVRISFSLLKSSMRICMHHHAMHGLNFTLLQHCCCSSWVWVYSLPFLPFILPLLWVYEAILPKHGCHFKQLLIKAEILNIFMYCSYLFVSRSSMRILSKLELKIPPFYPQTTF